MKNKIFIFLSLLISILIVLLILVYLGFIALEKENSKYKKEMKIISLLHDSRSFSVLYAMNKNNYEGAKSILASNLTNLVFNYDKELFDESRGLSRLCDDWEKGFKDIVLKDIKQDDFNGTTYQNEVLKRVKLIDNDCSKD